MRIQHQMLFLRSWITRIASGFLLVLAGLPAAWGQDDSLSQESKLRVYFDCPGGGCDFNFARTEMPFVDFVRDRNLADVHVLVTEHRAGGGGVQYSLRFFGLKSFTGLDDQLTFTSSGTATHDERRKGLTNTLTLGLVRYLAKLPMSNKLALTFNGAKSEAKDTKRDRWKNWVFVIGGNGKFYGQSAIKSSWVDGYIAAGRTTRQWKIHAGIYQALARSSFRLADTTIKTRQTVKSVYAGAIRALGNHWSVGINSERKSSTHENVDRSFRIGPAMEFSFFNYHESTRRLLTMQYGLQYNDSRFNDTTIHGVLSEQKLAHHAVVGLDLIEPWGYSKVWIAGSAFANHFAENRIGIYLDTKFRIIGGFAVGCAMGYSRVRDQRSLPKGTLTDEEILLQIRQLKTDYNYYAVFGFSYTFGSIYNNVVNQRLRGLF